MRHDTKIRFSIAATSIFIIMVSINLLELDSIAWQNNSTQLRSSLRVAQNEEGMIRSIHVFQFQCQCQWLRMIDSILTQFSAFPTCVDYVWTKQSRNHNNTWANHTLANQYEFPKCEFTPVEEGGPVPVIFIVNGRSGSDVTWATLSRLAGGKCISLYCLPSLYHAVLHNTYYISSTNSKGESTIGEHTGENKVKAMEFLGDMTEEEGAWWVTEHLCQFSHYQCHAPLSAFKFKPFVDSWELPAAQGMLKKIALFNQPKIKVIFMTRNPLDVFISKIKHKKSNKQIVAHCEINDIACISKQKTLGSGLKLPTGSLLKRLEDSYEAFEVFEKTLDQMNIEHVKTTYEDLYGRDDAEEWMKIFKYLGRGPTQNLSMQDVTESFALAPTFQKNHNASLTNYAEVRDLLIDTEFEALLH